VGKGPHSEIAVDIARNACEVIVMGNWDEGMALQSDREDVIWHQRRLGKSRIDYLSSQPFSHDFDMSGRLIRLVHASPQSVNHRVYSGSPREIRMAMFDNTEETGIPDDGRKPDIVAYGDVHYAYLQHLDGKTLINTGSVGNPLDLTQASYVILEGEYGSKEPSSPFNIQFVRVQYDVELAIRLAEEERMPGLAPYIFELRTGKYRSYMNK
jgi:protein phosphatase